MMQRPQEARGQRSGYQRNGVQTNAQEFSQTCEGILEDIRSPLSQTQINGRGGEYKDEDLLAQGSLGVNENNFKSQTLQF